MHHRTLAWFFYSTFFILSIVSCAKLDRVEPIPVYLHIDKINFSDSLATTQFEPEGFQKFSDAWVYVDEELVGVYEMPTTFPVLVAEGKHLVMIRPGIIKNGIASTRTAYEFVKSDTGTYTLHVGKIDTLKPKTSYTSFSQFKFIEDFESPNLQFDTTFRSQTAITRISGADVFKGQYSGQVLLTDSLKHFDMETTNKFSIPVNNANSIYLELNYWTDAPIVLGMYFNTAGSISDVSKILIKENTGWNKIYVDISEEVKARQGANFSVYMTADIPNGLKSARILIDEFKLVY